MKPEDLMIGDWFRFRYTIDGEETVRTFRITLPKRDRGYVWGDYGTGRQCMCPPERLEPIPITPEILEKSGFHKTSLSWIVRDGYMGITFQFLKGKWSFSCRNEIQKKDEMGRADLVSINRDWCGVIYVHEIQHALKLCGIYKEIIL